MARVADQSPLVWVAVASVAALGAFVMLNQKKAAPAATPPITPPNPNPAPPVTPPANIPPSGQQPLPNPQNLPPGVLAQTLTKDQAYTFTGLTAAGIPDASHMALSLAAGGFSNVKVLFFNGQGSLPNAPALPVGAISPQGNFYVAAGTWNQPDQAAPMGLVAITGDFSAGLTPLASTP